MISWLRTKRKRLLRIFCAKNKKSTNEKGTAYSLQYRSTHISNSPHLYFPYGADHLFGSKVWPGRPWISRRAAEQQRCDPTTSYGNPSLRRGIKKPLRTHPSKRKWTKRRCGSTSAEGQFQPACIGLMIDRKRPRAGCASDRVTCHSPERRWTPWVQFQSCDRLFVRIYWMFNNGRNRSGRWGLFRWPPLIFWGRAVGSPFGIGNIRPWTPFRRCDFPPATGIRRRNSAWLQIRIFGDYTLRLSSTQYEHDELWKLFARGQSSLIKHTL